MNIGVIFGGRSTEHDVSVLTALFVTNALGKNVYPIHIDAEGRWHTGKFTRVSDLAGMRECALLPGGLLAEKRGGRLRPRVRLDCAVNCCHGGSGENGDLAGMLALLGVPVTSSEPFSARAAMNKILTKRCLPTDVRTPEYVALRKGGRENVFTAMRFGFPLVVKPASGGSSIGVSVCRSEAELTAALELAFSLDEEVLLERYISDFKEVNCAVYRGPRGLVLSGLESPGRRADILSFDEKYMNFSKQTGDREFPAVLAPGIGEEIRETTARVYEYLGMSGIVRMDYMVSEGKVYFNEINSVPGSLAFYLFEKDFSEVLAEVTSQAVAEFRERARLVREFSSDLLAATAAGAKAPGK